MADKNLKVAIILAATDRATAVLNRAFTNAQKRAEGLAKTSRAFSEVGDKMLIGGTAMLAPVVGFVKAAADMEKMQTALTTSFQGNEVAAKAAFATINKFAAQTPYGVEEVLTAFIKLKNLGLTPSEAALRAYGNTASSMGKSLDQMIEAVADASTFEFERLKEFGIRSSQQGDKIKFTFQGVTTTVAKNSKAVEKYLMNIGNTKFAGGIEAQSKTLYGQLSTLSDNAKMVASSLGTMLIPRINQLFARIAPVIDKVQNWVNANPKLANSILNIVVVGGTAMLAFGGIMKVVGFIMSGLSVATKLYGGTVKALSFIIGNFGKVAALVARGVSIAFTAMGRALMVAGEWLLANPIVLIIAGIAVAALLIYKYWQPIKQFFINLWAKVKVAFSVAIKGIKNILLSFTPGGLIIRHWSKFAPYFSVVWDKVKGIFLSAWNFVSNLGSRFWKAGANIVKSVWEGMKSLAHKPVELIASITKKIRDFLPFSPAKAGALRDIHRIKLVETVAQRITAKPLVNAWDKAVTPLYNRMNAPAPAFAGGNTSYHAPLNLTINLHGTATQQDADKISSTVKQTMDKWWRDKQHNQSRTSFNS